MTQLKHYTPPDRIPWQGRKDAPPDACFFQRIQLLNLNAPPSNIPSTTKFALLGFASDEGVKRNLGRVGAAQGPDKIKQMLAQLPVHRTDFTCYDAGNITCEDGDLEQAQASLGQAIQMLLSHQITPIVLGGGHELAWGHYQGHLSTAPGIVNFDAHFDMRPLLSHGQGHSGSPFLQIAEACRTQHQPFQYLCIGIQPTGNTNALFETAEKHGVTYITAEDIHLDQPQHNLARLEQFIQSNKKLYVSLCLDVFSATDAPGVSAPQVMGLHPWQVIPLFRKLIASDQVLSYDIAELSPAFDVENRTAKLAAHFIYEILHHRKPA
jgi:formiminoglutamase